MGFSLAAKKEAASRVFWVPIIIFAVSVPLAAESPSWEALKSRMDELYEKGQYAEATTTGEQLLQAAEGAFGPEDPRTAHSAQNLARLYREQGLDAKAEPLYKRALGIFEKTLPPDHDYSIGTMIELSQTYSNQKKFKEAVPLSEHIVKFGQKRFGADNPELAPVLERHADLLDLLGEHAQAELWHAQAVSMRAKLSGRTPTDQQQLEGQLAAFFESHPDVGNYYIELTQLVEDHLQEEAKIKNVVRSFELGSDALAAMDPTVRAWAQDAEKFSASFKRAVSRFDAVKPPAGYEESHEVFARIMAVWRQMAVDYAASKAFYGEHVASVEGKPEYRERVSEFLNKIDEITNKYPPTQFTDAYAAWKKNFLAAVKAQMAKPPAPVR